MIIQTHTLPHRLAVPVLFILGLMLGSKAHAELFTIPEEPPRSMDDVYAVVGRNADGKDGTLMQALDQAMCGGWDLTESVAGKIPDVRGVPGRVGNALGNVRSGLATREDTGQSQNDGYRFPRQTQGLATACESGHPETEPRIVTINNLNLPIGQIEVEYPQIQDPICRHYDKQDHGAMTPDQCRAGVTQYLNGGENAGICPGQGPGTRFQWCDCRWGAVIFGIPICLEWQWKWTCTDQWVDAEGPKANSEACEGEQCRCPGPGCMSTNGHDYQSYVRQYTAYSVRDKLERVPDDQLAYASPPTGEPCTDEQETLQNAIRDFNRIWQERQNALEAIRPLRDQKLELEREMRRLEREITDAVSRITALQKIIDEAQRKIDEGAVSPLKEQLEQQIQDAQAQIDALQQLIADDQQKLADLEPELDQLRQILLLPEQRLAQLEQQLKLAQVAVDEAERRVLACEKGEPIEMAVACYGFYSEFDPKTRVSTGRDRRCVINFPFSSSTLRATQAGKGEFRGASEDIPVTPREPDFDESAELWDPNVSGAMSLLNDDVFEEKYDDDLSQAILHLDDTASLRAAHQNTEAEPLRKNGTLRAFDDTAGGSTNDEQDTGDARTFTTWWQRFQTDATRLMTPPSIRLRLPDTGAFALKNLPLREGESIVRRDARTLSIDVQLQADEDLLGRVAAYLKTAMLLELQEEPIPVIVPMGAAGDFRAVRDRWCAWVLADDAVRKGGSDTSDCVALASPEVRAFMERLEEYAQHTEDVRALRSELPRTIGQIVTQQSTALNTIGDWMVRNLFAYNVHLKNRALRLSLRDTWKEVQHEATRFADASNQPWCRNDRYTTPVYSLLDPWMSEGMLRGGLQRDLTGGVPSCSDSPNGLPMLCVPQDEEELLLDFSHLKLTAGSVRFPVLKPVQVRLTLPTPPAAGDEPDLTQLQLPSLPPVPSLNAEEFAKLPEVTVREPLPDILAPPQQMDLSQAFTALDRARSMLRSMNETMERYWKSLEPSEESQKLQCSGWNEGICMYTEVDLIEQFTRIMARPGILLREDFDSSGFPRQQPDTPLSTVHCDPTDHACLLLPPQTTGPKTGWQIVAPTRGPQDRQQTIEEMRTLMRRSTIDDNGNIVAGETSGGEPKPIPYIPTPESLYPAFDVPDAVRIIPEKQPQL